MLDYKLTGRSFANSVKYDHLIIAVDFDGTLCNYDGSPNAHIVRQLRWIKQNSKLPVCIILWTCRVGKDFSEALAWCDRYNAPIDYFNESPFEATYHPGGVHSRKLYADFYIDDHNIEDLDIVIGKLGRMKE